MDLTRSDIVKLMVSTPIDIEKPIHNLTGVNLTDIDLSNLDLRSFILKKVNLTNANINGANLSNVDLSESILENVNAHGVIFNGAKLHKCTIKKARISNCKLINSDISNSKIEGVLFKESKFENTNLSNAIIGPIINEEDENLTVSTISIIDQCSFKTCDFSQVDIKSTQIVNCDFDKSNFQASSWWYDNTIVLYEVDQKLKCIDAENTPINLEDNYDEIGTAHNFINNSSFKDVDFSEADMDSIHFADTVFNKVNLKKIRCQWSNFNNCTFENSKLESVSGGESKLHSCDFKNSIFKDVYFGRSQIYNCNFSDKQFKECDTGDSYFSEDERQSDIAYHQGIQDYQDAQNLGMKYSAEGDDYSNDPNKILFFDVETTGLPIDWKAHYSNIDNWPYIVQLGFIQSDSRRNIGMQNDLILSPENFEIPDSASRVHGISTEKAINEGRNRELVLTHFARLIDESKFIVAHNSNFDVNVLRSEFARYNITDPFTEDKRIVCTMMGSTEFCGIENSYGKLKWPTLSELHIKLFEEDFEGAHDAFADINATYKCFWKLIDLGVLN